MSSDRDMSSRLIPLEMGICFKKALQQKRRMIRRHRIRRQRRKKSFSFGEIISEILPKTYSKSITSIRNISLKPNRSSILNSLMMLLKYSLSRLLLIQLRVLPRWGFHHLNPSTRSATRGLLDPPFWIVEWMDYEKIRMFDETGSMNSANAKFDFIKHLNFYQKLIKQLITLFDENVWCKCLMHCQNIQVEQKEGYFCNAFFLLSA